MHQIRLDPEVVFDNITTCLKHYIQKNNILNLIIGLSGGIDSSLCSALAYESIYQLDNVQLIGRSIPIETNTPEEINRGAQAGNCFCDQFEETDLTATYQLTYQSFVNKSDRFSDTDKDEKVRRGNLKARIRMSYLFDLAHFYKGMVLSTDNLTELYLGFWTLHGDVGNYGMIQHLWKSEVYNLALYVQKKYEKGGFDQKSEAMIRAIDAVPTDGLGITTSDFDQIGVSSYQEADSILISWLNGSTEYQHHPIIKRYLSSEFKRNDPQNISRKILFQGI